jgi:hypothetical protein
MGNFGCKCGFRLESLSSGTDNQGLYVDRGEFESWIEGISSILDAFGKAIAEGEREDWLTSNFFSGHPPFDIGNEAIIQDLIMYGLTATGLYAYRCPECSRIYLQEAPGRNQWGRYSLEGHVGERWSEEP